MGLISSEERGFLEVVSQISCANPFLPERIDLERKALGDDFDETKADWNLLGDDPETHQINTAKIMEKTYHIIKKMNERLRSGQSITQEEYPLYEDGAFFLLYYAYAQQFKTDIIQQQSGRAYDYFNEFNEYWQQLFQIPGKSFPLQEDPAHMFACFFQVRRAFYFIFRAIIGRSGVAATLRGAVWTSIFTHDMRRYRRSYYKEMGDFTTLIVGPTGSGKELVARAIGLSRYIRFDPKTRTFGKDYFETFFPINLSALPSTLVESELFGHRRGAFTGAIEHRKGLLEICPDEGTVFLDEVGELDPLIQVKLLRVIQDRTFQQLGHARPLTFGGKIVAATHRDIHQEMAQGRFRQDFYYRLCSDIITTPSLNAQIHESTDVLWDLVGYISGKVAKEEGPALAEEVKSWIINRLGVTYAWPGNIRELEQCVRNIMIRREYITAAVRSEMSAWQGNPDKIEPLAQICRRHCRSVYHQTRSYVKTARLLKIDRRTVKKYVDS